MLIDNKSKVVNLCNIFHASWLENYFLSVGIIKKVNYSILAKKEKMTIFNDKINIALKTSKVKISYEYTY